MKKKRNLFEEIMDGFKHLAKLREDTPKHCCENCKQIGPVCDFCIHYDFNGDEDGAYTDNGYCRFHKKPMDPCGGCNDYECVKYNGKS